MQIGPNPLLMGRHYPLDIAAQCELPETLKAITQALGRVPGAEKGPKQRSKVRAYAGMLIEREENLVREHEHDSPVHPAVLEAQLASMLPQNTVMVQARSQGVDGEAVTPVKELEPALRRGMDKITRENRPYLIDVSVAREGIGAESTWYQDWQL